MAESDGYSRSLRPRPKFQPSPLRSLELLNSIGRRDPSDTPASSMATKYDTGASQVNTGAWWRNKPKQQRLLYSSDSGSDSEVADEAAIPDTNESSRNGSITTLNSIDVSDKRNEIESQSDQDIAGADNIEQGKQDGNKEPEEAISNIDVQDGTGNEISGEVGEADKVTGHDNAASLPESKRTGSSADEYVPSDSEHDDPVDDLTSEVSVEGDAHESVDEVSSNHGISEISQKGSSSIVQLEEADVDYSDYGLRDDELFWEASRVFEQEINWRDLVFEARELINGTKGLTQKSTKSLYGAISDVSDSYRSQINLRERENLPATETLEEVEDHVARLHLKVTQVLSAIEPPLKIEEQKKLKQISSTIREIETDIIPGMVGVLQYCLVAHYSNGELTVNGVSQLAKQLNSLSALCEAIRPDRYRSHIEVTTSIKATRVLARFMASVFESRSVILKEQGEKVLAQNDNQDNVIDVEESGDSDSVQVIETPAPETSIPCRPSEGNALFEGLRTHRGPDRYSLIARDYYDVLGHRNVDELRRMAQYLRDGLLALPPDRQPPYTEMCFLFD